MIAPLYDDVQYIRRRRSGFVPPGPCRDSSPVPAEIQTIRSCGPPGVTSDHRAMASRSRGCRWSHCSDMTHGSRSGGNRTGADTLRSGGWRSGELCADRTMAMFRYQNWLAADDSGNGVLEDELLLIIVFQQNGILIKRPYASRQFHAAYQVNGDLGFVFTNGIQKSVLNILCCLAFHFSSPCGTN